MGRKAGSIYLNPKKFGVLQRPCLKETMAFINCLALNDTKDNSLCDRQKKFLSECMATQSGKSGKPFSSVNYHLQRLMKGGK